MINVEKNKRFLCAKFVVYMNDISAFIKARKIRRDIQIRRMNDIIWSCYLLRRVIDKTDHHLQLFDKVINIRHALNLFEKKRKKINLIVSFNIYRQNRIFSGKSSSLRSFWLK